MQNRMRFKKIDVNLDRLKDRKRLWRIDEGL